MKTLGEEPQTFPNKNPNNSAVKRGTLRFMFIAQDNHAVRFTLKCNSLSD
eukprot:m.221591 g.221591  ORF g.221591 m.221591 type:complete len:50 (+) comp15928_c0_seq20:2017-2166(+)